jgi:predicted Zn-dependent protease with MMP-like domain
MLDQDKYWDCLDQAWEASSGGQNDVALAWLDAALQANPNGPEARNGRGEILWDDGRPEEALREFERALEAEPEYIPSHLNRIELFIEERQAFEDALDLCDGLLAGSLDRVAEAEIYYLKSKALFYLDDLEGALFLLRRALRVNHEVPVYHGFEGQVLFELGRLAAARESLERARVLEPESAHTLYHLALVSEHAGRTDDAQGLFVEAAQLAPEQYPLAVRMELDEVGRVAAEALASLPLSLRTHVRNCPILIEDLPDPEVVQRDNLSPQALGLFAGVPNSAPEGTPWSAETVSEPPRIVLYKRNIERVAQSREHLVEQIQVTLKHEIGHYLGLDEEEVERLGLA